MTDHTSGDMVAADKWEYGARKEAVVVLECAPFRMYTVSFLAFIIWDPVHTYNALTNEWEHEERQMTYDVWQPKTQTYALDKLRRQVVEHPGVDVTRFTTFFHQLTLMFDEQAREKFVDWSDYSASVPPCILEQLEQEAGYRSRPRYIINQGYYSSTLCIPTKECRDLTDFQMREAARLVKKLVSITYEADREVVMFLGDHWIRTEPSRPYFQKLGLDAITGSVGGGYALRLISGIKGVKYTEGRFSPYFFPDVSHEGGDPVQEARVNWVTAGRAILRLPLDRIGYGGYLKLASRSPDLVDYIEEVYSKFRELYEHAHSVRPMCTPFKVTILNSWGTLRD